MQKGVRLLLIVCLLVTLGIIGLQLFWLNNLYALNKDRFEKDVNLAVEDAIKQEFENRNDSIERRLFTFIMDTSEIKITSKLNPREGRQIYMVANVNNPRDNYNFSHKNTNIPILSQTDPNKEKIALIIARSYREEDLERHIIFYRTQNIGSFLANATDGLNFDTGRLRPFLQRCLQERNINEHFVFSYSNEDNTLNQNHFPDSITKRYPVISKAFPTYKIKNGENFVRAYFVSPSSYLFSRSIGLLLGSAVLIIAVSISFWYAIRIIQREKKLSAIKNDFINHITHEFKTPIATVYSALQALEDFNMAADPMKRKRYISLSKSELERLSGMVTRVLHISLYEQANIEMQKRAVDLDDLIKDLLQVYASRASLSYKNNTTVSQTIGDKEHLYNSINNLLDNAIKYSSEHPEIAISLHQESEWLILRIKDAGIGISKEDQQFIFDKFYRARQHGNVKGFGLGLSYVKEVIKKHNGWCNVESEPDYGSTFSIGLPLFYDQ